MYRKMAGMTGTAETEAVEFQKIYNLGVNVIPTNKPIRRSDLEDVVYKTENAKYKAMVTEIRSRSAKGQPLLVGTVSIEKSEKLSRWLKNEGVTHNVLNAKHHEREAEIVAQAGRSGAVTIATNMAGRGTDILLGGNPEFMAKAEAGHDAPAERIEELTKKYKASCEEDKRRAIEAGGLFIMGTERHESRRIDNQLRGRSGRQGDPGESLFYLSLEDNLMRIFNGERIQKIMNTLKVPEDEPITARMVSRAIEGAQRKVEGHNFDIRKHLLEYDDVMNQQRTAIYGMRKQILKGDDIETTVLDMLSEITSAILDAFVPVDAKRDDWDLDGLNTALQRQFGISLDGNLSNIGSSQEMTKALSDQIKAVYDRQKAELGNIFEQISRMLLLQTIDQRWKEHLELIDHLKEGIHLRGYAQKDPLIEYKKEAFDAFQNMNQVVREESIEKLLKIRLVDPERTREMLADHPEVDTDSLVYAGGEEGPSEYFERGPGSQPAAARGAGGGLPFAQPQRQQSMTFNMGDEGGGNSQLNREERRRAEKKQKKKKLKI
jgi:preprotein translocase subunit SecA